MSDLPLKFLLLAIAGWMTRDSRTVLEYVLAEREVLREQVGDKRPRLTDSQRRRLARAAKKVKRKVLPNVATLATAETLLGWWRKLVAAKYDGSAIRKPGRPRTKADIVQLVVRMATDNPSWGYTKICGALANVGHLIGRGTVMRILREAGIEPAPERDRGMSWSAFLRTHWGAICAMDFFSVEVLTLGGIVRYQVLFVIDLASRRVELCGMSCAVDGAWMQQMGRNITDCVDGFLSDKRQLIMDRDPLFTRDFRELLRSRGVHSVRLPARSPNLNAYAERFVRSVRQECLSKVVPLGEQHLRHVLREYVVHYNHERNHQGLGNSLIAPANDNAEQGRVRRRQRLGGMLSYYHRQAA